MDFYTSHSQKVRGVDQEIGESLAKVGNTTVQRKPNFWSVEKAVKKYDAKLNARVPFFLFIFLEKKKGGSKTSKWKEPKIQILPGRRAHPR